MKTLGDRRGQRRFLIRYQNRNIPVIIIFMQKINNSVRFLLDFLFPLASYANEVFKIVIYYVHVCLYLTETGNIKI